MPDPQKNLLEEIYPEADKVFSFTYKSAHEIKDTCLYVLDTNVLLVPFDTSQENLEEIGHVLLKLKHEQRLFLPAQVAREFAGIRAERIRYVYDKLSGLEKTLNAGNFTITIPFLESHPAFISLQSNLKYIRRLMNESREDIKNMADYILHWNGNDAVSKKYSEIFSGDIIIELQMDAEKFQKYFEFKSKNKVAPGYTNAAKDDGGKGDVIIWRTLIELGKDRNRDVVFVTNDQKPDWFYIKDKVSQKSLIPKYELLDEFRRETKGKSISMINFEDFLKLRNANDEVIQKISHIADQDHHEDYLERQAWILPGEDPEKVKIEKQRLINEINDLEGREISIGTRLGIINQDKILGYHNTLQDDELREIFAEKDKIETEIKFITYKRGLLQGKLNILHNNYPELRDY